MDYTPAAAKTLFDPIRRVYLFYGADDVQKDAALDQLQDGLIDAAFADFDLEALDAESAGSDRILSAAGIAPFASARRLVTVRGSEMFRRRDRIGEAERLAIGITKLPELTCLVLVAGAGDGEDGRTKTVLNAKLDKAIREHGVLVHFKRLSADATIDWLRAKARAAGKTLTDDAADRLAQAGFGERRALENEIEKAICFVGDGERISLEAVEAVCSYDAEDVMFKLVDAISHRNADRALFLLREILRYDNKPQSVAGRLLTLLGRQYRLLWQARELERLRVGPGAIKNLPTLIAEKLPSEGSITGMSWKAADLFRQARNWDRQALAGAFDLLIRTDLANKGSGEGSEDTIANLELLILALCRTK